VQNLPAASGWQWLSHGFAIYRRNPLLFALQVMSYWFIILLINIVPLLGTLIAALINPALLVGLMLSARQLEQDKSVSVRTLFEAFRGDYKPLLWLGGLYLLVGNSWQSLGTDYRWGIVYGLLTALCYSGFLLILRKLQQEAPSFSFFFNLMLVSGASALFLGLWLGATGSSFVIPDRINWLALLCLGLFSQTMGWALIAGGMPRLRASLTGLVLLVQPLLSFVWDVVFFDRPTPLLNWVGVTGTLLALYLGMLGKAEPQSEK